METNMQRLSRAVGLGIVLVLTATHSTKAQQHSASVLELGVDGRLAHYFGTVSTTSLAAPLGQLRVGYFISPSLSLEPYGALGYASTSNGLSSSSTVVGVGALYHFTQNGSQIQPYVRPFAEYGRVTLAAGGSNTASSYGVGLGVKIPLMERMSWRVESAYANGERTGSRVLLNFGLSVFTH
jgi:hypothetical protein